MKLMVKNISRIILSLLLIVSIFGAINVIAETAVFKVTKIEVKEKSDRVTVNNVSVSGEQIKNDIVFTDKNDYIKYNITIKNNTSDNYTIKSITDDNTSQYLEYSYDGLTNVKIAAGKEKTFELKIKYIQDTTDPIVTDQVVNLYLTYEKEDGTTGSQTITNNTTSNTNKNVLGQTKTTNPKTHDNIYMYLIIGLVSLVGLIFTTVSSKKLSKYFAFIAMFSLVIIPLGVKAATDKYTITIENIIKNADYTVIFNANGGKFSDNSTIKTIPYRRTNAPTEVKYSYTDNIDATGLSTGSYSINGSNLNILGTDRGDTTKAHVVTIEGAEKIIVDIYYASEDTDYDWTCVWEGAHPDYDCYANADDTINGEKLGNTQYDTYYVNGNQLTNVGYKRFVIDGDSVTFGFISDDSCGDYGYYAIIKAQIDITLLNPIEQPTIDNDLIFYGWCSNSICTKSNKVDPNALLYNDTIYAYWSEKESELDKGKFRTYTNVLNTNGYIPQTKIKRATAEEYNQVKDTLDDSNIISTTESPVPTYCWKTQDTIYYYSIGTIYLPEDSSELFWLFRYVEELDVSGFDTSRVKNMEMMFSQMEKIKKLDLSTFNTSQVTNMRQMFGIMNTLEELDISNFDTKNVLNMGSMFASSSNIKVLDLSSFDTSSVDNFREMFMSDEFLEKIYVSDKFVINTNNTYKTDKMFNYDTKLEGGAGTTFDSSHVSSEYARIDDPTNGKPGYFTDKKDRPQN